MGKQFFKEHWDIEKTMSTRLAEIWNFYEKQIPCNYQEESKKLLKEVFTEGFICKSLLDASIGKKKCSEVANG